LPLETDLAKKSCNLTFKLHGSSLCWPAPGKARRTGKLKRSGLIAASVTAPLLSTGSRREKKRLARMPGRAKDLLTIKTSFYSSAIFITGWLSFPSVSKLTAFYAFVNLGLVNSFDTLENKFFTLMSQTGAKNTCNQLTRITKGS
jgi:hypothetical protein